MAGTFWFGVALISLLLAGVFFAGCSEQEPATVATPVPTTAPLAKYSSGDIISRSALATGTEYYLILGYDPTADQYERAWIYKNADGTFGYRSDSRTDKALRTTVEKVYPVKISHVAVSSVPVVTPTIVAAVTTTPGVAPSILKISPNTASKDSIVSVTITGYNFQNGATVMLLQPGYTPVKATAVSVASETSIDCTFNLAGLDKGAMNLIVTNPDGRSHTMINAFTLGIAGPIISSVYPGSLKAGETRQLTIYGQNFRDLFKVTLTQGSAVLDCINPVFQDTTKLYCDLAVPATAKTGSWNLVVINVADQQTGQYFRPFTITNST
ncbi:IPT/TIG domain-containing protein [uncultured Methanoregula sp.]|uniref:IPT/TIG domain-containing protein n=1 Tax=uncultured Methanoregula sp. TaxID=1005933 RepID=UPI002AAC4D4D|nr:IPT/TIG domain-containing protein [uncultured Methanoregula sp.]